MTDTNGVTLTIFELHVTIRAGKWRVTSNVHSKIHDRNNGYFVWTSCHNQNIVTVFHQWEFYFASSVRYYLHCWNQGRIQEFILRGAKPRSPIESWGRSPNRGREAPEYRGRSPSRGREAPEYRGRSPSRGREAPENWGRSPNRGRSPRKSGGRGLGRGLGEPLPRKFLKNQTWNHSFWCIFEAIIWND